MLHQVSLVVLLTHALICPRCLKHSQHVVVAQDQALQALISHGRKLWLCWDVLHKFVSEKRMIKTQSVPTEVEFKRSRKKYRYLGSDME